MQEYKNTPLQNYTKKYKSGGQRLDNLPFVAPSVSSCEKMKNAKLKNYRNTKVENWWS